MSKIVTQRNTGAYSIASTLSIFISKGISPRYTEKKLIFYTTRTFNAIY